KVTERFNLNERSLVTEIASNDGYLLQYFKERNIPCLGIEPTNSTAQLSIAKGIENVIDFFGEDLAVRLKKEGRQSDLILGNNVLAHVPGLNDFVRGLKVLLKPTGIMTFEFPHFMKLIEKKEFDTIYHEHFSYFSFYFICNLFKFHGFEVFDVEQLETHGGSLRVYIKHKENEKQVVENTVTTLLNEELKAGVNKIDFYKGFHEKAVDIKNKFLLYILAEKQKGMKILKDAGLQSLPGGGAEIFHPEIRQQICEDKVDADGWLNIHKAAHKAGMHSNATMLFGHIEKYRHRVDHMERLRQLQDETSGFNTFIPLKFRNKD
ncbi:unnamed protein product, partial [marine sediment metagenome]